MQNPESLFPSLSLIMADEIGKARDPVNKEDGDIDENAPIAAANRAPKKQVVDSDDDDEVPLAISRAKKKPAITGSSSAKIKKEETTDQSGVLKENSSKKIGENSNSKASKVKKEETEDLKSTKPTKVKKEATDSEDEEMKRKTIKKGENKGKENKKSNSVKKQRQKKSYDLPGQKHDPPEERDPLRMFYESLYHQVPGSEMATVWMMERGLLAEAEAKRVYEKRRQKGLVSPVKPTSNKKSPSVNGSVKKSLNASSGSTSKGKIVNSKDNNGKMPKKQKASSEEDSDDDFIASPKISANKKLKV